MRDVWDDLGPRDSTTGVRRDPVRSLTWSPWTPKKCSSYGSVGDPGEGGGLINTSSKLLRRSPEKDSPRRVGRGF